MNPIRGLRRVPLSAWPATVLAVAAASFVEIGLHVMPLPRLATLVGAPLALSPEPDAAAPPDDPGFRLPPDAQLRVHAALRVLRHWPPGDTCLRQALVCGQLLRRHRPKLQVGVAKLDGEVRAHAWLVIGGSILDPRNAASAYQALTTIPSGLRK